ncbi:MAG: thiolase [Rhizobiales bacterium]|nr:thiolase [Hyphomicrobiales bacterium]
MRRCSTAIVGAAETTRLGKIPDVSELELHCDAALNALEDAGLRPGDVDGLAAVGEYVGLIAAHLGIQPVWADATDVGGCSFLFMVRHAAAAIEAGLCHTVLITHGESGRSRIGARNWHPERDGLFGQFELSYGMMDPTTMFTVPFLRYMKDHGVTEEQLALVPVIQREWAARNPRAYVREPITVDDVLSSPMVAWPFRKLMCCLVTDGGGAVVVTSAERAADMPRRPVYLLGSGEAVETLLIGPLADLKSCRAFRVAGETAFEQAGIRHDDVDHLMLYDAFAHLPIWGLEALGFVGPGEACDFIAERHTAPGGRLPTNTNGGGLSYTHTGMYGMFALQESIRQLRGTAPAQVQGARISVCHGVGNIFEAGATLVLTNEK